MNALWRGGRIAQARIVSGLVLFAYAALHMLSLGGALISPALADMMQDGLGALVDTIAGQIALYGALLTHFLLTLAKLVGIQRLRMPLSTWVQYVFGLSIPVLLLTHIVFTRTADEFFGVRPGFGFITGLIWNSTSAWTQAALLVLVWVHGCIGLHMWLRMTTWWRRRLPLLAGVAAVTPVWALAGYLTEGRRITAVMADPDARAAVFEEYNWPDTETLAALVQIRDASHSAFYAILGVAALFWLIRKLLSRRGKFRIHYVSGPTVTTARGPTLLEISRSHGVPHAALCGGRGRCSTCRVIIEDGDAQLSPPSPAEAQTLAAVKAPPRSRLACQIRPTHSMTVLRVFRPESDRVSGQISQGEERRLALLFLDIRGFTARTAGQLPYDVVFLLNRFFDAVVPQITGVGGHVDKYLGDGLLAVFSHPDEAASANAALNAAKGIGSALATFNATIQAEGGEPVRIGMGLHMGELVLGEIGAAGNAPKTIIGDTVNAASRLESETKSLGVELLVSGAVLDSAGYNVQLLGLSDFALRGRDTPLAALPVRRAAKLDAVLAKREAAARDSESVA